MPSTEEIVEGLTRIANEWLATAVLWHIVLACMLYALVKEIWRPSARTAALASSGPLASAAAFAWVGQNPFNGLVLSLATVALGLFASRLGSTPLQLGKLGARRLGAGLILFGWLYPHFLEAESIWVYTVASPIGLVPCPSLSILIGLGLYADSFGSRAWGLTAGVLGLFYGIVGVARLGVWIDLPLVIGAAYIAASSARGPYRFSTQPGALLP
jgi:hypothetical protein